MSAPGPLTMHHVVLDSTDIRELAEFYRALLGLVYGPGDEPPEAGEHDERGQDWLVLRTPDGRPRLAFQHVDRLTRPTWPDGPVAQQLHLDLSVSSVEDLRAHHERVLSLGGRLLSDNEQGPDEPFRVYADPAGHPFCIFVAESTSSSAGPGSCPQQPSAA
ncbi:VOC family protein [Streptomyces sp. NPDC050674]|uniref:VOC family protein n=1 Tax=Streptomyces sp. NPDC050674 TaxID=3157216 RepID=UPI00341E020B